MKRKTIVWRGILAITALYVMQTGIDSANNVLAEKHQVSSLAQYAGVEESVEELKEHGVPMTLASLIGYFLAGCTLIKAAPYAIPTTKVGMRTLHWTSQQLVRGARQIPTAVNYMRANPRTSVATTTSVMGTVLLTLGYCFGGEYLPQPETQNLDSEEAIEQVGPEVNAKQLELLASNALKYCQAEIKDENIKWWLNAGVLGLALFAFMTYRQKIGQLLTVTPAPVSTSQEAAPKPASQMTADEKADLCETMDKARSRIINTKKALESTNETIKTREKVENAKLEVLQKAQIEHAAAQDELQKAQTRYANLLQDEKDHEARLKQLEVQLWS